MNVLVWCKRDLRVHDHPALCMGAGRQAVDFGFVMAKMVKKRDFPVKDCACCGRPFVWRKAWAKVWDEVRYCSDKCRGIGAKK